MPLPFKRIITLTLLGLSMALFPSLRAQVFTYTFSNGYEGWEGDFADYPAQDSVFYELAFTRTGLPAPLNTARQALKITGNNHSDDLFMFIRRKITGLQPNTGYQVQIDMEVASNAPTNGIGVGGAPGEGVVFKAGLTRIRPRKVLDNSGFYLMNIDKANQSVPGTDMDTLGHAGVTDTTTAFALIHRSNAGHVFSFTTDSLGEGWVCIGTESGFESTTTLYYSEITLAFTAVTRIDDPAGEALRIWPNPSQGILHIEGSDKPLRYACFTLQGQLVLQGTLSPGTTEVDVRLLAPGVYILRAEGRSARVIRK